MRWLFVLPALVGLFFSVYFSQNGIRDWMGLRDQMNRTKKSVSQIEKENEELRLHVDLFRTEQPEAFEFKIRSELGLVRDGELVFYERGQVR